MDILDIDEALKDDSFIFLEDKTHDDVSNILQQWKSNNCMQAQQQLQQQQQQQEQTFKLNSRTFTRPKRKLVQNLEAQFSIQSNPTQQCNGVSPMLNLEIGGLVTTMQKSFLQDTSPPASICSSMDASIDRMNNSLITSADFINVQFLQSGIGQDFINDSLNTSSLCLNKTATNVGYTLSDMIRDRKALESLTLSGEGTLIKDCNIGQIDDISINLSKTASNCSTMDNSTESVETNNRTLEMVRDTKSHNDPTKTTLVPNTDNGMVFSDEMIGDTTLNLVETSLYNEKCNDKTIVLKTGAQTDTTRSAIPNSETLNETFKKPAPLDETIYIKKANCTYDCLPHTPETNCDTPEECQNRSAVLNNFSESTPQVHARQSKRRCTPSATIDEANISPIIAVESRGNTTRILSKTFECDSKLKDSRENINSETFSGSLPKYELNEFHLTNPNGTFSKSFHRLDRSDADIAMQNVMNLAQAEAELLAENENEEEFEHMLDQFSKIELKPEQLKMKKSMDIIKKRFTYGLTEKHDRELSREAKDMQEMLKNYPEEQIINDMNKTDSQTENQFLGSARENEPKEFYNPIKENEIINIHKTLNESQLQKDLNESPQSVKESSKDLGYSPTSSLSQSMMNKSGSGTERLLSRRSRLYDNINLSTVSVKSTLGNSFAVQKNDCDDDNMMIEEIKDTGTNDANEINDKKEIYTEDKTEDERPQVIKKEKNNRRFMEKRERDRDRFKTIEIVKQRSEDGEEIGERLNVPCIDDMVIEPPEETSGIPSEQEVQTINERSSRRDITSQPSNFEETNGVKEKTTSNQSINYMTYKKKREKSVRNNPSEAIIETIATSSIAAPPMRSLSRPRYISGLQKFGVVSKATSAGDLEKTSRAGTIPARQSILLPNSFAGGVARKVSALNQPQSSEIAGGSGKRELKSPMGIKSKSFHNLSSNFGGGSAALPQKLNAFGFKKSINTTGVLTEKQLKTNPTRGIPSQSDHAVKPTLNVPQQQQQKEKIDEKVFKVPKLVSGIRAPSNIKRAGLVRPSSGYYSLNAIAPAKNVPQTVDIEFETDRQSPTDSMSSASSSRSSVHSSSSGLKPVSDSLQTSSSVAAAAVPVPDEIPSSLTTTITLTKITTGATGIPKPSGLRPPSKRSGLPRPASILKR